MNTPVVIICILSAVALTYKLIARKKGYRGGLVAKMIASTGFLAVAILCGAADHTYGRLVFAALVLCWAGDWLLALKGWTPFLIGLFSFLGGHLLLAPAFLVRGTNLGWSLGTAAIMVVVDAGVLVWVFPHVQRKMRVPVLAYVAVITVMVVLAAGTYAATGASLVILGAVIFYISDIIVARERFVSSCYMNYLVNLPLYYLAVFMLALSVAL
jgi:uncharacterized membrane protein YhhN